jgi:xanthine dehydrogenase small subunit
MAQVQQQDGVLHIGAGASLEDAWAALVRQWPALTDVWLRFASPPIRNAGTMGGNVANGSPIGDSPPVLMALDAEIELRRGTRVRRMPLAVFYLDYMKNQLEPGEFVQALRVPLDAAPTRQVRAYKISKRFDCDISALCAGFTIDVRDGVVHDVRLAFGGMAATVRRALQAETALRGQPWTQATVQAAQQALAQDFTPLSDMRASAGYRLQVAQNLLQRLWLETRANDALPPEATSVWSVMPHGATQGA